LISPPPLTAKIPAIRQDFISLAVAKQLLARKFAWAKNLRGEGDMLQKSLSSLDIVLGSFHSSLRTTQDQTDRYLAALRNPNIQILGHPRDRIYNYRIGLSADWPRVFAETGELDKALEIDCYPDRQDLNVGLLKVAREHGTRISIGTDAHHPWQLQFIELGASCRIKSQDFVRPNHQFHLTLGLEELGKANTTTQLKSNAIVGVWLTYLSLPLTTAGEFVFDYTV
jgi:hypothetical protein